MNRIDRRRFLKRASAALALGTGVSAASQSAAADVGDKHIQIEVVPLRSETSFDIEFASDLNPEVSSPINGDCSTHGSTVTGSITGGRESDFVGFSNTVTIGLDRYDLESISVDDGPAVIGAQFIEENFTPVIGAPSDEERDRFCQIEVSGDGKYFIGVPYKSGVETCRGTKYGDAWGVNDTAELNANLLNIVGSGPTGGSRETSSFVIFQISQTNTSGTFHVTSQDHIVAMDYKGEDEPVENRFGPTDKDNKLTNRSDPHDGVGIFGLVDGYVDKYQTAGFEKDPADLWGGYDLYGPSYQMPSWFRLEDGVDVEIFTTNTARDCRWV